MTTNTKTNTGLLAHAIQTGPQEPRFKQARVLIHQHWDEANRKAQEG